MTANCGTCEDLQVLVSPRPGTDRQTLLDALRYAYTAAQNTRGGGGTSLDRYNAYIRWANESVRMLRSQVTSADLDLLVLTRRYWALQSLSLPVGDPVIDLVKTEIDERVLVLEVTCQAVESQIKRWSQPGVFVVADSSFYIEHDQRIEDLDLRNRLGIREESVHLVVPIAVVDELDGLKQSKDKHTRWRARHTLDVLDGVLADPQAVGLLRPEDFTPLSSGGIPRGAVTTEIVLDQPGHERLPIMDDEIIDRTLAIQALAGRQITLLTYDTGQSTRARAVGLKTVKIRQAAEDEEPSGRP